MEIKNIHLQKKFREIEANEVRFDEYKTEDAEVIITSYGLTSRVAKKAVDIGREQGIKLGLFRPITVWPFPKGRIAELASRDNIRFFISVEMSAGQMVEDIQLNVCGKKPVHFYGRMGGIVPSPQEILDAVQSHLKE